jgi:hypothetical protein
MLAVAPRRLALLLLSTACFYDNPPGAGSTGDVDTSTGDASTTGDPTTGPTPTSTGDPSTSTGDVGTSSSGTTEVASSTGDTDCTPTQWYPDLDLDGHGDAAAPMLACTQPAGHVASSDDCDDTDAARAPDGTEVCDDKDNDCDLVIDEYSPKNPSCKDCTLYARAGRSYAFCTLLRVWTDARVECMKRGGDLVIIDDAAENADLAAQGAVTLGTAGTWSIGLNDLTVEGTFVWLDTGMGGFTGWGPGEPNDLEGEDCAVLIDNGLWNDQDCELATNFLCEVTIPP